MKPVLTKKAFTSFSEWLNALDDEWMLDMILIAAERLFESMPQVQLKERVRRSMLEIRAFNFLRFKEKARLEKTDSGIERENSVGTEIIETQKFARRHGTKKISLPFTAGVVRSSHAVELYSYLAFSMMDVHTCHPGAEIQLPSTKRPFCILGLPAGTSIHPPKGCEYGTADVPRYGVTIVPLGDKRQSWLCPGGSSVQLPSSLTDRVVLSLPKGTVVTYAGLNDVSSVCPGLDAETRRASVMSLLDDLHERLNMLRTTHRIQSFERRKFDKTGSGKFARIDSSERTYLTQRISRHMSSFASRVTTMALAVVFGFLGINEVAGQLDPSAISTGWSAPDPGSSIAALLVVREDVTWSGNFLDAFEFSGGVPSNLNRSTFEVSCAPQRGRITLADSYDIRNRGKFSYVP